MRVSTKLKSAARPLNHSSTEAVPATMCLAMRWRLARL
jgi:hypothetical protein